MEYLGEVIALGIDSVILVVCLRQYFHCRLAVNSVKNVQICDVGVNLHDIVKSSETDKFNYVASNEERIVQDVYNTVPFALQNGSAKVEVTDALSAEILDMDVLCDEFKPNAPTVADLIWEFFTGFRQRGMQSTEEMLREGVTMTGVGELTLDKAGNLTLQPPIDGTPFYLTTMNVGSLLRKLDERRRVYKCLCIIFGTVGLVVGGMVVCKYRRARKEKRISEEKRQNLEESRKKRRQRVRDIELREDQICVVCKENPREVILLPCGHVCLCEDCSASINDYCPGCRAVIEQKNAAYII
ncbi:Similar to Mul1: Mitochondrial E3 ubiquitin protein ligase 1 (Drosophila melanogaster) [Cotesia congregata]|uniref:RING-type E3 ubiquitin transferase n=1 Tax=Cotesia congregata TaxID=51543 RepID=A0A8J2MJ81_COTCN|nr:Similar to Mul1: Mitochondrial E3 ubiquitin protein ligase 1 (Drosophila melanogaster) [Cotesia congregata]